MNLLRTFKTDLTFNQEGCEEIPSLIGPQAKLFSLDLSSATDRFPVEFQEIIVSRLIGQERAEA